MSSEVSPAQSWVSVTASDTTELAPTKSLFIGGAGNIAVQGSDGNSEIFAVTAGYILPVRAVKVLSTGTTATSIIAFY